MKKIFTLCAYTLIGCAMSMHAATGTPVTVKFDSATYYPSYSDHNTSETKKLKSFDATFIVNSDGSYELQNFFNTENSVTYTVGAYNGQEAPITFTGNLEADYDKYYYFKTSNNKYFHTTVETESGETFDVRYLEIYQSANYTYVYKSTEDEIANGYDEYYVYLNLSAYTNSDKGFLDMDCYFSYNLPEGETPVKPEKPVSLGNVSVDICNENDVEVAKGYSSELTVSSDGIYTLANFINSGASLSFTFDESIAVEDYAEIQFKGKLDSADAPYYYILDSAGEYPTGKLQALSGDAVTDVYYPLVYQSKSDAYVTRVDKATYGYDYYASIYFSGFDAEDKDLDDYYLQFYFNGPDKSGLSVIAAEDENAPVEYYNLNGQRIADPANGIFIRKQGSKVEKVVIR